MKKLSALFASAITAIIASFFLAIPFLVPVAAQAQTVPTCPAGYTCTPNATASLSLDPSSPLAGTVPVTNTTQGTYLHLPVLVFDVKAQGDNLHLHSVPISITNTGGGSVLAAYLYQGSTEVSSASVVNGVATFSNIPDGTLGAGIPINTVIPFMIKVDVSGLTQGVNPAVITASAGEIPGWAIYNSSDVSVTINGSAQGNTQTVAGVGPAVSIVGTPTISDTNITQGGVSTQTYAYTATFNVNVTAVGEPITLGLTADTNPAFGNASTPATIAETYINGVASPISGMIASYSQPSGTTLSTSGTSFTIGQNQTVTIPVTYSFIVNNPGANVYGVRLLNMNYSNAGGKGSVPIPNACTLQANCSTSTSSSPSVTVTGTPTLALTYNSARQESALTATFNVTVNGGNQGVNIYQVGSSLNFIDQNGNSSNVNLSAYPSVANSSSVTSGVDDYGRVFYKVPAGKNANFQITASANPQQMFAGTYHAVLYSLWANSTAIESNAFNLQVPANQTNTKTIVGEIAPYITSVSPNPATVGQTFTINGQRLSAQGLGVSIDSNPSTISSFTGSTNTSLSFILPSLSSNSSHTIQVIASTGASNRVAFQVTSGGTSNQPPVISGLTAPTALTVGQTGTWIIQASDPQNGSLSYSVNWGDNSAQKLPAIQTTTFTHSYATAGTYTVSFTVTDSAGLTAQTSTTVTVSPSVTSSATASLSLDPSSPPSESVTVTNATTNTYLGLPVLIFDVSAQGGPLTLNGLDASFSTSGSGSLTAAYLYQGSTEVSAASISNVPGAVANFGKFSSISIPAGSSLPFTIKVDVSSVSGSGFTVSSNINPIAVSLVNSTGGSVVPGGSAQGNAITVIPAKLKTTTTTTATNSSSAANAWDTFVNFLKQL